MTALAAANAMVCGWKKVRPHDQLELLPMSDGGDDFGEIIGQLLGAKTQRIETVDAAHRPMKTIWWRDIKNKIAIIDSAKIIGLAQLAFRKFHPFELDTFGLGKVLQAAADSDAKKCLIGIGGSATNDSGFGMARALGWKFLGKDNFEIRDWWQLHKLAQIKKPTMQLPMKITIAIDVQNFLLGASGCTRIYGPQKGLRQEDFFWAEKCLRRLAKISARQFGQDFSRLPGAGAAGGLGFGLMTFTGGKPKSGFELFAQYSNLGKKIQRAHLVMTGEGSLDQQTLMGKGVGQIARLCQQQNIPCLALAGMIPEPEKAKKIFTETRALTEITSLENAKRQPAKFLEKLASQGARSWVERRSSF